MERTNLKKGQNGFVIVEDLMEYAEMYLQEGEPVILAEKDAKIKVRPGKEGEVILSWTVDSTGAPLLEKEATVRMKENREASDWVATKIDEQGNPVMDANGHINEWILGGEVLERKYEIVSEKDGIYKPRGGVQMFLRLREGIQILQWGSVYQVDVGGYINITNPADMYVIASRDFEDTYHIL